MERRVTWLGYPPPLDRTWTGCTLPPPPRQDLHRTYPIPPLKQNLDRMYPTPPLEQRGTGGTHLAVGIPQPGPVWGYPSQVWPVGYPSQVQLGGDTPAKCNRGCLRWDTSWQGWGTPQPGLMGGTRGGVPPSRGTSSPHTGLQMEYLIRRGRYASCVHAGGLFYFHVVFKKNWLNNTLVSLLWGWCPSRLENPGSALQPLANLKTHVGSIKVLFYI